MKKKRIIVILMLLAITTNVQAITSNDVTYDNNGTTENLTESLDTLYNELKKYKTGGSVEANQMLAGVSGYSKGVLVTGTIPSKGATTYTPGTTNQTIASGQYLSGTQTIAGDADLKAENIKSGVNLFGVNGTYTNDATATAADILTGKTAYVNGRKVTGQHGASNHSIGVIWANSNITNGTDACSFDDSYTFTKSGRVTVYTSGNVYGYSLSSVWSRRVYLNGTAQSAHSASPGASGNSSSGADFWTFAVQAGQVLRVYNAVGGTASTARSCSVYAYAYFD